MQSNNRVFRWTNWIAKTLCVIFIFVQISADREFIANATALKDTQMYRRSTNFVPADTGRLERVLINAACGKDTTIAFIGGSITEGYNATNRSNQYVQNVYKWWCESFPFTDINMINAGVGGTSSYLGVHRVKSEVLDYMPDLVFIEFSVNDAFSYEQMQTYENLIRRILIAPNEPAVVLVFMTDKDGSSQQDLDCALGTYYRLPMISYGNAVMPEIEAGSFLWSDISSDSIHPNDRGHIIIAELINQYLEDIFQKACNSFIKTEYIIPPAITPLSYMNAMVVDSSSIMPTASRDFETASVNYHFTNDWDATGKNAVITFTIPAANIGLIYQRCIEGYRGQYDVYIDDKYVTTLDGNFDRGKGTETDTIELYRSDRVETHKITIIKNADSENYMFTILGLLIS